MTTPQAWFATLLPFGFLAFVLCAAISAMYPPDPEPRIMPYTVMLDGQPAQVTEKRVRELHGGCDYFVVQTDIGPIMFFTGIHDNPICNEAAKR